MNYDQPRFPPMPPIVRTKPKPAFDYDAALAESLARNATIEQAQASKRHNDAVLATAPDSPEAAAILARRAYMKTVKANAKARGYRPPQRRR